MIPRLSISTLFPYTTLFRSRFINCIDILTDEEDQFIPMSTSHYFNFSSQFKKKYLPYAIELGRSWVQPMYQPSVNRSEEHTSELQSRPHLVCRLLLEKKKKI